MLLDLIELLRRERACLPEHGVADADLADVVEEGAQPDRLDVVLGQLHVQADGHREGGDAVGMAGRVGIARVKRLSQGADHAEVGGLRLGLGQRHRRSQRVEGLRERVQFEAHAARRHGPVKIALARHLRQRAREVVNRRRQRRREPPARDRGEEQRAEADAAQHQRRFGRRGRQRLAHRVQGVDPGRVHRHQAPDDELLTVEFHASVRGQRHDLDRRAQRRREGGANDPAFVKNRDVGPRLIPELARVGIVERRGEEELADRIVLMHQRNDGREIGLGPAHHDGFDRLGGQTHARANPVPLHPLAALRSDAGENHASSIGDRQRRKTHPLLQFGEFDLDRVHELADVRGLVTVRVVGVDRGFERGILRQHLGLGQLRRLVPLLEFRESQLARLQVLHRGVFQALTRLPGERQKHGREDRGNHREAHPEHFDEQARGAVSATGGRTHVTSEVSAGASRALMPPPRHPGA